MADLRTSVFLLGLVSLGVASNSTPSHAEWWKVYTPKDFEDCAAAGEQPNVSKEAKAEILANCDSRFAGRRKAGGGYTYFDFMQNRSFDIVGPNPTQDELKRIDQEYLGYLEEQRKTAILAAFTRQQQQAALPQQVSLAMKPATPAQARLKQAQPQQASLPKTAPSSKQAGAVRPPADLTRARKDKACSGDALSCGWTKFTTSVSSLRQTLLTPAPKASVRPN